MSEQVLVEVGDEMDRQLQKWGPQNHASYTPCIASEYNGQIDADSARMVCDSKAAAGNVSWTDIFLEEVFEAVDEAQQGDLINLRKELVQVAAVACSWIQSIDRNGK